MISSVTSYQAFGKMRVFKNIFSNTPVKEIQKNNKRYLKVCEFIDVRREYRFKVLDFLLNIMRFIMLAHALQFPGFKKLSHIFISICGIFSTSLSIFNVLIGEQVVRIIENKSSLLRKNSIEANCYTE